MNITRKQFEEHLFVAYPNFKNMWPVSYPEAIQIVALNHFRGDVYGNQSYQIAINHIQKAAIELYQNAFITFVDESK